MAAKDNTANDALPSINQQYSAMSANPVNPENRIPDTPDGKWTEIEHLPEWDEEFYNVYTAKKHGKWVMLKALRPEIKDEPEYRAMLEKEFEVRYNLSHPNIVMINDFEDIAGIGRCIITDDVYGDSLRRLIDEGRLTDHQYEQLLTRLPAAMEYIQQNHLAHHPIRPETILFTENVGNLKLIDVGFDQRSSLSHADTDDDIYNYGAVIRETLERTGRRDPVMSRVAARCTDPNPRRRYRDVQTLRLAIAGGSTKRIYVLAIAFLAVMVAALALILLLQPEPTTAM